MNEVIAQGEGVPTFLSLGIEVRGKQLFYENGGSIFA